jgi:hypothetical protein
MIRFILTNLITPDKVSLVRQFIENNDGGKRGGWPVKVKDSASVGNSGAA